MRYAILDINVLAPSFDEPRSEISGVAVLVRYGDRPVDFWLEEMVDSAPVTYQLVAQLVAERSGRRILRAALDAELPQNSPVVSESRPSRRSLITVAICTKDRSRLLARTLASLDEHLAGDPGTVLARAGIKVEILVVDNNSVDDQTKAVAARHPRVRYVRESLAGLDFARNRAISESEGDLIAYLDDDAVVDRGWLPGLADAWTCHPDAGGFTGQVLPLELETEAQVLFEKNGGFRRGFEQIRFEPSMQSNKLFPGGAGVFGTGTNMAFRRDILIELGGFDEALDTGATLPGGGDHDIFYRVIRAGYAIVYEPRYLVFHEHRRELDALRRQFYSWGTGVMAFLSKSLGSDPSARSNLRAVRRWWFRDRLRQVYRSLRGRHPLPPGMVWMELKGGLVGIMGEYARSRKRIDLIRRES